MKNQPLLILRNGALSTIAKEQYAAAYCSSLIIPPRIVSGRGFFDSTNEIYVALVVYMPDTVGNEANYQTGTTAPTINMGIKLIATQIENTTAFEDIVD